MLIEPDRAKRHRLFECSAKPLDAFVAPNHLLRRIDSCIDFKAISSPLAGAYDPEQGRPAVPPEVMVRALVIGYAYAIPSFRRLCAAIDENLSFRWFLFLGLEDEVFDPSTITVFLRRVGPGGCRTLLARLNHQLSLAGVLSDCTFADSTLVPAAVASAKGPPTSLLADEFLTAADQENGIFSTREVMRCGRSPRRPRRLVRRHFQDSKGQLPLNPTDLDARWRRAGGKFAILSYRQHILVEDHGFILGERTTHSTDREADPLLELLREAPVRVRILTADTGYSLGMLRRELRARGIESHIPLHTRHIENRRKREGFDLRSPRELICPAGKVLKRSTYYKRDEAWLYAAKVKDCQSCPRRAECLPPSSRRRFVQLSEYEQEFNRACITNATDRHRRLARRRKTVVEGVFARMDRLGFYRTRRRRLDRVQAEGTMVAFVHNVLKATRHIFRPHRGAASERAPVRPVRSVAVPHPI